MRVLAALALLLLTAAAPAPDMIAGLCRAAMVGRCPPVVIAEDPGLASTDGRTIRVSPALKRLVRSPDEMAFALAHELGHIVAQHGYLHPNRGPALEYEADMLATQIVLAAGYRCLAGAELLDRIGERSRARNVRHFCEASR